MAWAMLSWMPICMAATLSVPSGREPRKLIIKPQKKILNNFGIKQR